MNNQPTAPFTLLFLIASTLAAHAQAPVQPTAPAAPAQQQTAPAPTSAPPTQPAAPVQPTTSTTPPITTQQAPPPPVVVQIKSVPAFLAQKVLFLDGKKVIKAPRKLLGYSAAPVEGGCSVSLDKAKLTDFLTKLGAKLDRKGRGAMPHLVNQAYLRTGLKSDNTPRAAVILPPIPTVTLLVDNTASQVLSTVASAPLTTSFPLEFDTKVDGPSVADLTGIDSRIAHFVTHFDPTEAGRTVTVKLAIKICDGHVIKPGDIFSVNGVVGERTAARGFGVGKVFINGTMQDQLGGGMCQVATTLYNAALLANLKIVERHPHARTVPYVPAGGDATVYYGEKDFQFENNTKSPIYLSYKTRDTYCIADLYGKGEPDVKVKVVDIPTRLGLRHYKGVLRRYVTTDGKTVNDYTSFSDYNWPPGLDYVR